ncbi:MAG: radical SAM protein [Chlamydiales bacterium]|jgi:uncharacterized protein|nr:radical SAM protein [Chlamydiales bacterium]
MKKRSRTVVVILKTVERCNLNCTYCYFFNGGDLSFKKHPPFISEKTISELTDFLIKGIKDYEIDRISIIFHGGEPTLQPIRQFESMCQYFRNEFSQYAVDLELGIQTNGTLINDRWIDVFSKYRVSVGVSLDGPKQYNDVYRIDHKGNGSYDLVEKGIRLLHKAVSEGKISQIGALCVINVENDPKTIYRHFVDNLNLKRMDFLLPDFTHDDFKGNAESYGDYLCQVFEEWVNDNNPEITVRILESIMRILVGRNSTLTSVGPDSESTDLYAFTVSSNGELSPDDTLRGADCGNLMQISRVSDTYLKDFMQFSIFHELKKSKEILPQQCTNCCWQKICRGGSYIHRYSKKTRFNNPSIMCEGLRMIYTKIASFLLESGYPRDALERTLFGI